MTRKKKPDRDRRLLWVPEGFFFVAKLWEAIVILDAAVSGTQGNRRLASIENHSFLISQ